MKKDLSNYTIIDNTSTSLIEAEKKVREIMEKPNCLYEKAQEFVIVQEQGFAIYVKFLENYKEVIKTIKR